jgi:hypothetical protein
LPYDRHEQQNRQFKFDTHGSLRGGTGIARHPKSEEAASDSYV